MTARNDSIPPPPPVAGRTGLGELALLFLKLGTIAFGGPAAHIAMMEEEVVRRRGWLTHAEFLDLLGVTNLIPGPNSTEMAIHIGHRRAGWAGLLVAGACFILPAFVLVGLAAWVYVRYGRLPQVSGALYGVKPIIIAVIAQALWNLGRTAIRSRAQALVGLLAAGACLAGGGELPVLIAAGVAMAAFGLIRRPQPRPADRSWLPVVTLAGLLALSFGLYWAAAQPAGTASPAITLPAIFRTFAKIGSVLYGSGYVLLAFLQGHLVEQWHWLTPGQLLDATAVGQVTPGPVFTTATFIGYLLQGPWGAVAATAGIFLPAFVFVALSGPLVPRIRRSPTAGTFLDGVNAGALALMAVVAWKLGRAAVTDWPTVVLALTGAVLLLRWRVNSAWLVLLGLLTGWLLKG